MKRIVPLILILSYGIFYSKLTAQVDLNNGLLAHYPLDGNANDISGNNFDGVVNGASLTLGLDSTANGAYLFTGSEYIEVTDSAGLSGFSDLTISAWVSMTGNPSNLGMIVSKWAQSVSNDCYALGVNSSGKALGIFHMDGYNSWGSLGNYWLVTNTVPLNEWHHLTYLRQADSVYIFMDGVLQGQRQVADSAYISSSANMIIGAQKHGSSFRGFKGAIDEIRIYGRALNMQELDALYTGNIPEDTTETVEVSTIDNLCYVCDSTNAAFGKFALNDITGSSNTAIGVSAGQYNNGSGNVFLGYKAGQNSTGSNKLQLANNPDSALIYGDFSTGRLGLGIPDPGARLHVAGNIRMSDSTEFILDGSSVEGGRFKISKDGKVTINTLDPGEYHLAVDGKIKTREVNVTTTEWADYVFDHNYALMPLSSLRTYIDKEGHLPEVPKTSQVLKNGLNLGQFQITILKKIEELTLYLLELEQRNTDLQKDNAVLQHRIDILEREIIK